MRIEIVTTPNETMKESGFGSLTACQSVYSAIERNGYDVKLSICKTIADLNQVVTRKPDLVVLAVKYIPLADEDDIWLSDFFRIHGINFSGSLKDVLDFDSNKELAKSYLMNRGIPTANFFVACPGQYTREIDLPIMFPLFLKPVNAANGNGIDNSSYVSSFSEYQNKISSLFNAFGDTVLVEQFLDGREYTVALIQGMNGELITSAVEIIPPLSSNGLRILSAQAKRNDSEKLVLIDDHVINGTVTELAIETFNLLGARDFGRVDIKADKAGKCFFMEVNLVPGMTYGTSYFPVACRLVHNFDYDKVVDMVIAAGLSRVSPITTTPGPAPINKSM